MNRYSEENNTVREPVPAAHREQEMPIKNGLPCIQDMVIADMEKRKAIGLQRYGTLLQPFNGRDALRDLYEELLDAAQYVRQEIEEREIALKAVSNHFIKPCEPSS